jgi:integrase
MAIHKRGDTWQARVDLGPDPSSGKRRQVSASFHRRSDAERWERERLAERDKGLFPSHDRRPLATYLAEWLPQRAAARKLRPSTVRLYAQRITLWIVPHLGGVPLADLKARQIHTLLYETLTGRGLSNTTLGHVLRTLRSALADAERLDLVVRNEAMRVQMPEADSPPSKHWRAEQVRAYLTCARHDSYWPLWLLAAHTGMRRGELAGLRWRDLDVEAGTIRVVQQIVYNSGQGRQEGPPKTKSSTRVVALSPSCLVALRLHRATQREQARLLGKLWKDRGLVFCTGFGGPLNPNRITDRHAALCVAAGLPHIRLHDMRHTASSLHHQTGTPLRVVADMLGHADIQMTGQYTHADLAGQQRAAAALDRLLAGDDAHEEAM